MASVFIFLLTAQEIGKMPGDSGVGLVGQPHLLDPESLFYLGHGVQTALGKKAFKENFLHVSRSRVVFLVPPISLLPRPKTVTV